MSLVICSSTSAINWQTLIESKQDGIVSLQIPPAVIVQCQGDVQLTKAPSTILYEEITGPLGLPSEHVILAEVDIGLFKNLSEALTPHPDVLFILFYSSPYYHLKSILTDCGSEFQKVSLGLREWRLHTETCYRFFAGNREKTRLFDIENVKVNPSGFSETLSTFLQEDLATNLDALNDTETSSLMDLTTNLILRGKPDLIDFYDEIRSAATLLGEFGPTFPVDEQKLIELAFSSLRDRNEESSYALRGENELSLMQIIHLQEELAYYLSKFAEIEENAHELTARYSNNPTKLLLTRLLETS